MGAAETVLSGDSGSVPAAPLTALIEGRRLPFSTRAPDGSGPKPIALSSAVAAAFSSTSGCSPASAAMWPTKRQASPHPKDLSCTHQGGESMRDAHGTTDSATADRGHQWFRARPQPRQRGDLLGFNPPGGWRSAGSSPCSRFSTHFHGGGCEPHARVPVQVDAASVARMLAPTAMLPEHLDGQVNLP